MFNEEDIKEIFEKITGKALSFSERIEIVNELNYNIEHFMDNQKKDILYDVEREIGNDIENIINHLTKKVDIFMEELKEELDIKIREIEDTIRDM